MDIFLEDLEEYFNSEKDRQIVEAIKKNTLRFVDILSSICDAVIPHRSTPLTEEEVH